MIRCRRPANSLTAARILAVADLDELNIPTYLPHQAADLRPRLTHRAGGRAPAVHDAPLLAWEERRAYLLDQELSQVLVNWLPLLFSDPG
jgi:hypothetical protein